MDAFSIVDDGGLGLTGVERRGVWMAGLSGISACEIERAG